MLTRKRCAHETLAEMVGNCQEPISVSELYYKMETSWGVFRDKKKLALRFKLIEILTDRKKPQKFQTTRKGKEFLETWQKLQTFLSTEDRG